MPRSACRCCRNISPYHCALRYRQRSVSCIYLGCDIRSMISSVIGDGCHSHSSLCSIETQSAFSLIRRGTSGSCARRRSRERQPPACIKSEDTSEGWSTTRSDELPSSASSMDDASSSLSFQQSLTRRHAGLGASGILLSAGMAPFHTVIRQSELEWPVQYVKEPLTSQ